MSPDATELPGATKIHKDEPAIEPIPTPSTRPVDAPSPPSANISNAGGLVANGFSPASVDALPVDDIGWLFEYNQPVELEGMTSLDDQGQMDTWLLDAAQNTFTSFDWEGDPSFVNEFQEGFPFF